MNVIEIMLLPSRRYTFLNCSKGAVISAEHNATEIRVQFPQSYESYSKRVDFVTSKGNPWAEKLYVPEFEEYSDDFDKNVFSFTLPNEVTIQGELKMQFVAYMPDDTLKVVPFDVIPIYIEYGLTNFKKSGKHNPDLLILSYNQSTKALMYSEQAKSFSQSAEQKADEALSNASQAKMAAESVAQTAQNAEATALDAKAVSAAAAHTADMAYTASGNAILKADDALAKSEEAKGISQIAAEKAESAMISKVDKVQGKELSSNDYTDNDKQKLSEIEENAEVNVQSDWKEINTESDAYIKNKPSSLPADGGNADTVDGKHASDFATSEQGNKADNAVPNSRKINGKDLNSDITLVPSDLGAATASQGAKADTALQSFTEADPTVPSWAKQQNKPAYTPGEVGAEPTFAKNTAFNKNFGSSAGTVCEGNDARLSDSRVANGGNADTVDGKHSNDFATSEQGIKADNAVPNTRKINNKALSGDITLNPSDIGAATSEQGAKADSALQSFIETDPTVPAWAKEVLKPGYFFNEISGLLSGLQISEGFFNAGKNTNVIRNPVTGNITVSAEIPIVYTCNGVNDNVEITNIVKNFYNDNTISDFASLKLYIVGKLGINDFKQYGTGAITEQLRHRAFDLGVSGYTGNKKLFLDFGGCEVPMFNIENTASGVHYRFMQNYNNPVYILNLNLYFKIYGPVGQHGGFYGDNWSFENCYIYLENRTGNGNDFGSSITGIWGNNARLINTIFDFYGPRGSFSYGIRGDNSYLLNSSLTPSYGILEPIWGNNAIVLNSKITVLCPTGAGQQQVNGGNDSIFANSILEIEGTGILRANSGQRCLFLNCELIATATNAYTSVSVNAGSSCFFSNCKLTGYGTGSGETIAANSGWNCFFSNCTLISKSYNQWSSGRSYTNTASKVILIGCDIYAYKLKNGEARGVGVLISSTVTNKCIIVGCRFMSSTLTEVRDGVTQEFETGAEAIILEGTTTGAKYMITNNFLSGTLITHTATGDDYVKTPNMIGGSW